ncbi:hypothetical protein L533_2912 [Bordetella bronchiseptica OSU553]|nr:hypothetical protein L533_2912 [Bordetella bronchiseptica OSU553]
MRCAPGGDAASARGYACPAARATLYAVRRRNAAIPLANNTRRG